jgi:parvulin-like peptidyl-prolyl isomerase
LALVNGEPIFADDLEAGLIAMHSGQSEQTREDFDLRRLLDGIIGDTLLAQEATALGMAEENPIPIQVERKRQELAVERLEWDEVISKSRATEEEKEEAFQELYRTATFRVVTLYDKEAAAELRAMVDESTDFEALAEEKSVDTYKGRGGLVEDIDYFDMPASVGEAIFSSEPGAIHGPLATNVGWAIVKVVSTQPADPSRRESLEGEVEGHVRFQKAQALRADLGTRLRELHGVSTDAEAIAAIRCEPQSDGRLLPGIDDPGAMVAQVGERAISSQDLGSVLQFRWKNIRNVEAAEAMVPMVLESMITSELMRAEALRQNYGTSAEVEKELTAFQRQLLTKRYLQEVIRPGVTVSQEEVREYYDEHLATFRKPPRVQVGQITVAEEEEAERLVELLHQGSELAWLARQHSIDRFKANGGDRGWMVPSNQLDPIETALYNAEVGEVVGPYGYPGNFLVLQVGARKDQGHYSFEEAAGQIRSRLFGQKFAQEREATIAELRSRSEITVFEDALAAIQVTGERDQGDSQSSHGH